MPPQQPQSQKMLIDLSGRGGLAPRWYGDEGDTIEQHPEYRYLGTQDQTTPIVGATTASDMAAGIWNPSRRYGFMSPANNSFTAITTSFAAPFAREIRATAYDPLSQTAFYGDNGSVTGTAQSILWQNAAITANVWTPVNYPTWGWPITVIANFTDTCMYQINGVPFLFASYDNTSGTGDILVKNPLSGTNASLVWLSTVASNSGTFPSGAGNKFMEGFDHFFVPSTYYMYVCEANFVHRIDGTATGGANGTALGQVLVAASNVIFSDGISWNGLLYLAASETYPAFQTVSSIFPNEDSTYSSAQARVYVWDESVTSIENVQYITITGVKLISKIYVTRAGNLRMLVVSAKRTLQIRQYNGVSFDVIEEAAITAMPRYRHSVQMTGDTVTWIGKDGNIYSHGPVTTGEVDQLNIIGNILGIFNGATLGGTFYGASLFLDNNNSDTTSRTALLITAYDGTAGTKYATWYPNITGTNPHTGNVFTLVKYFPQLVKVNYVRIYHHQGTASVPATVQGTLGINFNGSATGISTSITQQDIAKGFKYVPVNQGAKNAVFGIQFNVNWATGTTTADATDWLPRMIEVDFTPLDKLM